MGDAEELADTLGCWWVSIGNPGRRLEIGRRCLSWGVGKEEVETLGSYCAKTSEMQKVPGLLVHLLSDRERCMSALADVRRFVGRRPGERVAAAAPSEEWPMPRTTVHPQNMPIPTRSCACEDCEARRRRRSIAAC